MASSSHEWRSWGGIMYAGRCLLGICWILHESPGPGHRDRCQTAERRTPYPDMSELLPSRPEDGCPPELFRLFAGERLILFFSSGPGISAGSASARRVVGLEIIYQPVNHHSCRNGLFVLCSEHHCYCRCLTCSRPTAFVLSHKPRFLAIIQP